MLQSSMKAEWNTINSKYTQLFSSSANMKDKILVKIYTSAWKSQIIMLKLQLRNSRSKIFTFMISLALLKNKYAGHLR